MDSKTNAFSYWTVVPGANVGKVPIPSRFVESTQGSERYRTVCHNDGDLKQGAKDFSLCMKHQQGTCRMGDRCHQLHVNTEFFDATKFWEEVRRTCCAKHEDFNSRSDEFMQMLNSYKFEVAGVQGPNTCCPVDGDMLARTAGLMEMIRTRSPNDPRPIQFSVRHICRLHINDECRFGRDCGRIHVCRDFVNRELPLPPVPRKKGREGHSSSPTPAFGGNAHAHAAAPFHNNNTTPWMRGAANTHQPMPQPTLAQLQQAAAVGALFSGRMPALTSIDVNKSTPQQRNGLYGAGLPPGVMGIMGRGLENPGTPLSINTPGSLPNIVRSVVDMTLTDEAEGRRRQANMFAALPILHQNSQNVNPNAFLQQYATTFGGKMENVAPASSTPPAHHFPFNPKTAPSRPLGDLTNKSNFINVNNQGVFRGAIGGKTGAICGVEGGERDYSMFAGRSLFSFDA